MTTIAIRKYKDRIELAADSLGNDDGVILKRNKIFSKANCSLSFAHTGNYDQALILNRYIDPILDYHYEDEEKLYDWLFQKKEEFRVEGNDVEHFLIAFHQKIYDLRLNKTSVDLQEIQEDFYAGGFGRSFAIAAMECGKSPKEAVEIAAKYSLSTGGEIKEIIIKHDPS